MMPGNQYSEDDWARLRWVEHRIGQLIEEWREAAGRRHIGDPYPQGKADALDDCARDLDVILTTSRLPGGPPLTAGYVAAQIITWTKTLQRMAGTVDAEIIHEDTAPRDALDDIDEAVAQITDGDVENRLRSLIAAAWQAKAGSAADKERQLREYDALNEDLTDLRDRLEASPDPDLCAAGVRLRAILDNGGQDRLEAAAAAGYTCGTGGGAETWADVPAVTVAVPAVPPGMVTVSVQDLRDVLEDWGYECPVAPGTVLEGDLPVFRLTRAAYGDGAAG